MKTFSVLFLFCFRSMFCRYRLQFQLTNFVRFSSTYKDLYIVVREKTRLSMYPRALFSKSMVKVIEAPSVVYSQFLGALLIIVFKYCLLNSNRIDEKYTSTRTVSCFSFRSCHKVSLFFMLQPLVMNVFSWIKLRVFNLYKYICLMKTFWKTENI